MLQLTTALRKAGTAVLIAEDLWGRDLPFSENQLEHLSMAGLDSMIFRTSILYNPEVQGNHSIPIDPAMEPEVTRAPAQPAYFYEEG